MGAEVLEEMEMEPFVEEVEARTGKNHRTFRFLWLGRWPGG